MAFFGGDPFSNFGNSNNGHGGGRRQAPSGGGKQVDTIKLYETLQVSSIFRDSKIVLLALCDETATAICGIHIDNHIIVTIELTQIFSSGLLPGKM